MVRETAEVAVIFAGKVIKQELRNGGAAVSSATSMTPSGRYRVVSFDVSQVFRGEKQQHFTIITGLGTGDCGYPFETNEEYLVYANKAADGMLMTSICTGTATLDDSAIAIRYLKGEKPAAEDLLSPQEYEKNYHDNVLPKKTGSICGLVTKPDGTPLKGAIVEMWELRNDDLPPNIVGDENTSSDSGHFCIEYADPGRYILTAEDADYDHDARYMSFYPGVYSQEEATEVDIKPGVRLPDVKFTTFHEPVFTMEVKVVTPDGTVLSYKNGCGVVVDSVYKNRLSYHLSNTVHEDGTARFGYVPPGNYVVQVFFQPDYSKEPPTPFPDASKWKPARKKVTVSGDTTVVVTMEPATSK